MACVGCQWAALILLSVSRVAPELTGSAHLYLDCLGALDKVKNLPPHCIPSKFRHSDVLKNIMVHCSDLSFTRLFSHVLAHQDDRTKFGDLARPAQLNCGVYFGAKRAFLELDSLICHANNLSLWRQSACLQAERR